MKPISAPENERKMLLNGCYRTPIQVYPSNWHTKKGSMKKNWYIWYRYFDPLYKDLHPNGMLVSVRGMNDIKELEERQKLTRTTLDEQHKLIDTYNYNPITKKINTPPKSGTVTTDEVTPQTLFIDALRVGKKRLNYVPQALRDVESVINGTERAAKALGIDSLFIRDVSRKHFVRIFEKCRELNERFSVNRQNMYRAYLMAIFKQLIKLEAIEHNPLSAIEKETKGNAKTLDGAEDMTDAIHDVLTADERKLVDAHLHEKCYTYWRYMQTFFHSGARSTELFRVKESHVDIQNQRFKTLIMKGRKWVWVWRTIKDIALPLWEEMLKECADYRKLSGQHATDPYLFGKGLQCSVTAINPETISRRWRRWVITDKMKVVNGNLRKTNGLGIKKRFYDIKHLHSTEIMDTLEGRIGIEQAEIAVAEMNAHTSTDMLQQVYDVKNDARKQNRIKGIRNSFA